MSPLGNIFIWFCARWLNPAKNENGITVPAWSHEWECCFCWDCSTTCWPSFLSSNTTLELVELVYRVYWKAFILHHATHKLSSIAICPNEMQVGLLNIYFEHDTKLEDGLWCCNKKMLILFVAGIPLEPLLNIALVPPCSFLKLTGRLISLQQMKPVKWRFLYPIPPVQFPMKILAESFLKIVNNPGHQTWPPQTWTWQNLLHFYSVSRFVHIRPFKWKILPHVMNVNQL